RRRHTRFSRDWSSDVCSSDLESYYFSSIFLYFGKQLKQAEMKKIITLICFLPAIFAMAQTDLNFGGNKLMEDLWFKTVFNQNIADVEGSPYYEKNFQPAKLTGT